MAVTIEQGLNPKRMTVGDHVMVRATITAINSASAGPFGGAGDTVTCLVDCPGNVGEVQGVSFTCSPIQMQWRAATYEGH